MITPLTTLSWRDKVEKVCKVCGVVLTEENCTPCIFRRMRGISRSGSIRCRCCQNEYAKKRREFYPAQHFLNRARGNAKSRGLEFTLALKDIPAIPEYCPVFPWMKLIYKVGTGKRTRPDAPSLDRFDNSRGYIPGNVRFVSYRANTLKRDAELKELVALGEDAKRGFAEQEKSFDKIVEFRENRKEELSCSCGKSKRKYQRVCSDCFESENL